MNSSKTHGPTENEYNMGDVVPQISETQSNSERQSGARKARKEAKFTARLNQDDFEGMKLLAVEKGIPYQTLLGHIIHLYVERKLVDVTELQKLFDLKRID